MSLLEGDPSPPQLWFWFDWSPTQPTIVLTRLSWDFEYLVGSLGSGTNRRRVVAGMSSIEATTTIIVRVVSVVVFVKDLVRVKRLVGVVGVTNPRRNPGFW